MSVKSAVVGAGVVFPPSEPVACPASSLKAASGESHPPGGDAAAGRTEATSNMQHHLRVVPGGQDAEPEGYVSGQQALDRLADVIDDLLPLMDPGDPVAGNLRALRPCLAPLVRRRPSRVELPVP